MCSVCYLQQHQVGDQHLGSDAGLKIFILTTAVANTITIIVDNIIIITINIIMKAVAITKTIITIKAVGITITVDNIIIIRLYK